MKKKKFLAALERYMEREWRAAPPLILVFLLWAIIRWWLDAHYSLPKSNGYLLSGAVVILAFSIYGSIERVIRRKRGLERHMEREWESGLRQMLFFWAVFTADQWLIDYSSFSEFTCFLLACSVVSLAFFIDASVERISRRKHLQ